MKHSMLLAAILTAPLAIGKNSMASPATKIDFVKSLDDAPRGTSTRRYLQEEECSETFVKCANGRIADVNGRSTVDSQRCEEACDGECCVGEFACDAFTGRVCKDGMSCSGNSSCYNAKIGMVVRGCNGTMSCLNAAAYGGIIEKVIDSCVGSAACSNAAVFGGSIEAISKSCKQDWACNGTASCSPSNQTCGSSITVITSSCNGLGACSYNTSDGVSIASMNEECNDTFECNATDVCEGITKGPQPEACDSSAEYFASLKGYQYFVLLFVPLVAPIYF